MTVEWQSEIQELARDLAIMCFSESEPDEVVDAWVDYADDCLCDYLHASKDAVSDLRKRSGLDPDAFMHETRKVYFREFEGVVRERAKVLGKTVETFDPS